MRPVGQIFCLDLGMRSGFAHGRPGAYPTSGTVILKRPDEETSVAGWNLICFLQERFAAERPALVVKEKMLHLPAQRRLGNGAAGALTTSGLHAIVEAMCRGFGVRCLSVAAPTIRKHFIGHGRLGSRDACKAAVITRCHVLSLMPRTSRDDNRADALATWDYAAHTFGRARAAELHLFNETAA